MKIFKPLNGLHIKMTQRSAMFLLKRRGDAVSANIREVMTKILHVKETDVLAITQH